MRYHAAVRSVYGSLTLLAAAGHSIYASIPKGNLRCREWECHRCHDMAAGFHHKKV